MGFRDLDEDMFGQPLFCLPYLVRSFIVEMDRTDVNLEANINSSILDFFLKAQILSSFFFFIYFWLCWVFVFCARAFSSCGKRRGPLFIAVRGPLTVAASRCAAQAPDAQAQ